MHKEATVGQTRIIGFNSSSTVTQSVWISISSSIDLFSLSVWVDHFPSTVQKNAHLDE